MNLGGTNASRLVKSLEGFLGPIMDSLFGTCNFGMLGIKVGLDHSTIVAVLAFISFLGAILKQGIIFLSSFGMGPDTELKED